jgi:predicted metal-binding transcription factor (methanogenesis marker protein 9)
MKIMKSIDKKVGEITYYKYKINLPKKIVEESKFLDKEVKVTLDKGKIIIEEKNKINI